MTPEAARPEYADPTLSPDEQAVVDEFHKLYHGKKRRSTTPWMGSPCLKLPGDPWIYQEIVFETRPTFVIETGTQWTGSARYLGSILDALHSAYESRYGRVVTIDAETCEATRRDRRLPSQHRSFRDRQLA